MPRILWNLNLYKRLGIPEPVGPLDATNKAHQLAPKHAKRLVLELTPVTAPAPGRIPNRTPPRGRKPSSSPPATVPPAAAPGAAPAAPPAAAPAPAPAAAAPADREPEVIKEIAHPADPNMRSATIAHSEEYRERKLSLTQTASEILDVDVKDIFTLPSKSPNNTVLDAPLTVKTKIKMAMDHLDVKIIDNDVAPSINLICALLQAAKGTHSFEDLPEETRKRHPLRGQEKSFLRTEAEALLQTVNGFQDFDTYFKDFPREEKERLARLKPSEIPTGLKWDLPIGQKQMFSPPQNPLGTAVEIPDVRIKLLLQLIGVRYNVNIKLDVLQADMAGERLNRKPSVTADPATTFDDASKKVEIETIDPERLKFQAAYLTLGS